MQYLIRVWRPAVKVIGDVSLVHRLKGFVNNGRPYAVEPTTCVGEGRGGERRGKEGREGERRGREGRGDGIQRWRVGSEERGGEEREGRHEVEGKKGRGDMRWRGRRGGET